MAFKPNMKKNEGKKREPIETGSYDARCYGCCALGTHIKFNKFKNAEEPISEMLLFFEIPELQVTFEKDGEEVTLPRAMYPRFKISMHEKAKLRQFIEAWFNKSFPDDDAAYNFDFSKLIGHGATLNVEQNGEYSNIKSIGPLHKAAKLPKQINDTIDFGVEDFSSDKLETLYPWVQGIIRDSSEYACLESKQERQAPPEEEPEEDDIPF